MVFTFTKYTTIINKKEILILIFFINKPMPATCVGFLFFYSLFLPCSLLFFIIAARHFCFLDLPHHSQSRVLRTLSRCFAAKIAHYVASYVVSQLHMYISSCLCTYVEETVTFLLNIRLTKICQRYMILISKNICTV